MTPFIALLLVLFTSVGVYPPATFAVAAIEGHWLVNEDDSDDPHEQLEGLYVVRATPISPTAEERARAGQSRQKQVFQELEIANIRRGMRAEADIGDLARVLNTEDLTITPSDTGYVFKYSDGLSRNISPRHGGPVYTAKGDEFVADELGKSMVYWRGNSLVIETLLAPRGNMSEEISLKPGQNRLKVHTKLSNPDWLVDAEIIRVFDPPSE
ncbi:MAG: hypothetical protein EXR86_01095 [Gammaproteobacteria bacterium]|nr:hypothetical protein [Gammaproteobacteria bacterium]